MTAMRLDCDVSDLSAIASKSTKELKLNSLVLCLPNRKLSECYHLQLLQKI